MMKKLVALTTAASTALVPVAAFAQTTPAPIDTSGVENAMTAGLTQAMVAVTAIAPAAILFGIVWMLVKKFAGMARSGG
jgi:hypothetical protein